MSFPPDIFWIFLAISGGIARYLDKYVKGEQQFKIGMLFASLIITAFTGYMSAEIMLMFYPNWALIAAGVGGYAGTQFMDVFVVIVKNKLSNSNNLDKN